MILGLGSDMVDVRRIARSIERYGERFLGRIFTPAERAKAENRANTVETYAKRFAAKEACSKALGTGFRPAQDSRAIVFASPARIRSQAPH